MPLKINQIENGRTSKSYFYFNPSAQYLSLAKKLSKSTRTTRAFPLKTGKYNSNAYRDSFVQSTLRILRDGQRDMYIPSTTSTRASQPKPPTSTAPHFSPAPKVSKAASITCPQCKRVCKSNAGLASHLRVHRRTTTNT